MNEIAHNNTDLPVHQNDEDVTELELLELFGSPVATTNMKELKKKGESGSSSLSRGNYFQDEDKAQHVLTYSKMLLWPSMFISTVLL